MSPAPTRTALPDGAGTAVGGADAAAVPEEAIELELSEGPAVAAAGSGAVATGEEKEEGVDETVDDPQAASEAATRSSEAAALRKPIGRLFGFTA
jgi:hypothetical protein